MQSDTHSLTSQFACPAQIPCKRYRLLKLLEYAFLPQNGIFGNSRGPLPSGRGELTENPTFRVACCRSVKPLR